MNAVLALLSDVDDNHYLPTTEWNSSFSSFLLLSVKVNRYNLHRMSIAKTLHWCNATWSSLLPYKKMKICFLNKWYARVFPLRVQQSWIIVTVDIYRIIICALETEQSRSCKWLIYPLPASAATPRRDEIDLLRHRQTVVLAKAVICILPFFMPVQWSGFIKTNPLQSKWKTKH